jgi:hypothetical protein
MYFGFEIFHFLLVFWKGFSSVKVNIFHLFALTPDGEGVGIVAASALQQYTIDNKRQYFLQLT